MSSADELYRELIEPVEERMMRAVARIVRDPDDAADAFQNALLYIWKDLKRIHQHPNPHAYIIRACVSAAYDILRKRSRQSRLESPLLRDEGLLSSLQVDTTERETEQAVINAIASLPRQQAEAVLLRLVDGEPFNVIALVLNCSETTARSHVSKGRAKLRTILSGLNPRRAKENEV